MLGHAWRAQSELDVRISVIIFAQIFCAFFFPGNIEVRAGLRTARPKRAQPVPAAPVLFLKWSPCL